MDPAERKSTHSTNVSIISFALSATCFLSLLGLLRIWTPAGFAGELAAFAAAFALERRLTTKLAQKFTGSAEDTNESDAPANSSADEATRAISYTSPEQKATRARPEPPRPPAAAADIHNLVPQLEWNSIIRNSRDGGANSILASNVLNKTAELLSFGRQQVSLMLDVAQVVRQYAHELTVISEDIRQISAHSRIVALNASVEAARAGQQGRTFHVVSLEMGELSESVKNLTAMIDEKLGQVNEKIRDNQLLCGKVANLFVNVNRELSQFKGLMMRIEDLSTRQTQQLRELEERVVEKPEDSRALTAESAA